VFSFLEINGRTQFGRRLKDTPKTQIIMNTPATTIFSSTVSVWTGAGVIETKTTRRAAPATDNPR
jgi:hypothetical protein